MTLPVLGIYAENSGYSQPANQEYLKTVFPNLEYVEIPGTDHFLMMEKPGEFNRLLLAFLDKVYRLKKSVLRDALRECQEAADVSSGRRPGRSNFCDGLRRRDFLQAGSLAALGLSLTVS